MTIFASRLRSALLLTSAAAGLAWSPAAHADDTGAATAATGALAEAAAEATAAAEDQAGNAIVVTGVRRRDEDVQTIPVAISVIDASTIEDANISQLGDFQQLIPSLKVVSFNPRNTNINIRGLGANIALTNDGLDPGVGFYIDDVFYARPGQAQFDLIDIEQVEVLRGPQGTLFGRNTTAGAINIRTRRPTYDPQFMGDVTVGDYGFHQVRGSVSGALVDDLAAFRLSFAQSNRGGFLINSFNGEEAQDLENVTVRGQLLIEPASNLSLLLIGDYAKQRQDFVLNVVSDVFTTFDNGAAIPNNIVDRTIRAGRPLPPVDPFARRGDSDSPYQSNMESYGVQATLTWDLGGAKLTSISAYRWWDWDPANDGDSTSLPVITRAQVVNRLRQFSQEIRLASQDDRPLSYSLGAYYYWQTNRGTTNFDFGSAAPNWFVPAAPVAVSTAALNGFAYKGISTPTTKSFALFGQSVWKVTDALQVTAGLRYTNERKNGRFDQRQISGVPIASLPVAQQAAVRNIRNNFGPEISFDTKFTDNNLSGLLAVSYNVADDVLAYGSFSFGRKSPGLNLTALPAGVDPEVRAEDVTSYEVGLKASLFDRRLTANLAGFWTDITDYQTAITDQDPNNPTVFRQYIANAPKVRSRGIEADVIAAPTDRLRLTASAAYTDAYYVSFPNAPQAPERANLGQIQNLTGEVLAGVPKFTYSLAADYAAPLGDLGGAAVEAYTRADYSHRSAIFTAVTNSRFSEVPGYGLVNARIGIRREDGRWDLSVWARNLADTDYFETLAPGAFGLVTAILGAPRTVGVTFRTNL